MLGVIGINPHHVVVAVMINLVDLAERLAAIGRFTQFNIHHEDAIDVLRISDDPAVIHRSRVEFVPPLPVHALVAGAEDSSFAVRRFHRRVDDVRIGRRHCQTNPSHIDGRQS